ncbi:MAG: lysine--tRNA ligase [Propionibacteriaceae bacterium]|jgi:lysyl-tRNA synthetase class 2|nr:lysine--tRNA ligase [Propionibacteriaceae bacterium]
MTVRRGKRERLLAEGVPPYPVAVPRTHSLAQVREQWGGLAAGEETEAVVSVAGRVVFLRNTGKLCFATLQDGFTARSNGQQLQVMLSVAEVGQDRLRDWKEDVDLGDFVSATGRVIASRRGELSVLATSWAMASKALRPLPVLFKELSEENRVRQRHIDLVVRPQARRLLRLRSAVTKSIRDLLDEEGFLEVETPVLQLVHGGAAARPFQTRLNAFDQDMTLRIALELHLKRVMVGGADRVYEIGRIFRNEGIDSSHSAEFSMLEFYAAWQDMTSVADLTRRLVQRAADVALGHSQLVVDGQPVDLDGPWRWAPFYDLVSQAVGDEITPETPAAALRAHCQARQIDHDPGWSAGKLALKLYSELVEKDLIQPTFVHHYPAVAQPLARLDQSGRLVQAWDLIIAGTERGTGFSELIDPVVQRQVLTEQSLQAAAGDPEAMRLDEDFLAALEVGAPPMGGVGLGIDRLLMLLGDVGIRETILFPLLRPAG